MKNFFFSITCIKIILLILAIVGYQQQKTFLQSPDSWCLIPPLSGFFFIMIYKSRTNQKFAQIPNDLAQNQNLSIEAIGLMTYLLSLPFDWAVNKEHLRKHFKMGKQRLKNIMSELISMGYIVDVKQEKSETGRFVKKTYLVYAEPYDDGDFSPMNQKPSTVNGSLQINNKQRNIEKINKKEPLNQNQHTVNLFCKGYGDVDLLSKLPDKEIELIEIYCNNLADANAIGLGEAYKDAGWEVGKPITHFTQQAEMKAYLG